MPLIIEVVLVLAVLGFAFYMLQKIQIASPFRECIYFVVCIAVIFWLLETFGMVHTHVFHWR